jgi:hypothetical protein
MVTMIVLYVLRYKNDILVMVDECDTCRTNFLFSFFPTTCKGYRTLWLSKLLTRKRYRTNDDYVCRSYIYIHMYIVYVYIILHQLYRLRIRRLYMHVHARYIFYSYFLYTCIFCIRVYSIYIYILCIYIFTLNIYSI